MLSTSPTKFKHQPEQGPPEGYLCFPPSLRDKTPSSRRRFFCAPTEIRTPVLTLKGSCPGPLDDGGCLHLPKKRASGKNFTIGEEWGQPLIKARIIGSLIFFEKCMSESRDMNAVYEHGRAGDAEIRDINRADHPLVNRQKIPRSP